MSPIIAVFDIDGVLRRDEKMKWENVLYHLREGAVITAIKAHLIFPGIIELMQLIFSNENIKVHFFSAGRRVRNEALVRSLLTCALGESRYNEVKEKITICSKEHLSTITTAKALKQKGTYGLKSGLKKKDLTEIVTLDELPQTILIDDQPAYVQIGQEKNFLNVSTIPHDSYNHACYIAGLLFQLMESAQREGCAISDVLFRLQFKKLESGYQSRFEDLAKDEEISALGLKKLREINDNFSFMPRDKFLNCAPLNITEEEICKIQECLLLESIAYEIPKAVDNPSTVTSSPTELGKTIEDIESEICKTESLKHYFSSMRSLFTNSKKEFLPRYSERSSLGKPTQELLQELSETAEKMKSGIEASLDLQILSEKEHRLLFSQCVDLYKDFVLEVAEEKVSLDEVQPSEDQEQVELSNQLNSVYQTLMKIVELGLEQIFESETQVSSL